MYVCPSLCSMPGSLSQHQYHMIRWTCTWCTNPASDRAPSGPTHCSQETHTHKDTRSCFHFQALSHTHTHTLMIRCLFIVSLLSNHLTSDLWPYCSTWITLKSVLKHTRCILTNKMYVNTHGFTVIACISLTLGCTYVTAIFTIKSSAECFWFTD